MYCEKYVEMAGNTLLQNHAGAWPGDARRTNWHYSAVFEQNRARQRAPEYGPGIPHRDKLQVKVSHLLEAC